VPVPKVSQEPKQVEQSTAQIKAKRQVTKLEKKPAKKKKRAVRSSIDKWKDELREIPDIEEEEKGNSEARTTDYGHFNAQLTDYGHFNAPNPTLVPK